MSTRSAANTKSTFVNKFLFGLLRTGTGPRGILDVLERGRTSVLLFTGTDKTLATTNGKTVPTLPIGRGILTLVGRRRE